MTRAETVAREMSENWYPEMSPEWRAGLQRLVTEALVAFGREAEEVMRERAAKVVEDKDTNFFFQRSPEMVREIMAATIRALPPGAPDAHAMSAGADPEEEAIERAHDEARRHAGEDSPYA